VMASDTNVNWFLIRVRANTLIDASAPTSVPNVVNGVVQIRTEFPAGLRGERTSTRLPHKLRLAAADSGAD